MAYGIGDVPSFIPGEKGYRPPGGGVDIFGSTTGIDFQDILSKLSGVNPLVPILSKLGGGLFSLLAGPSWSEKKKKELYGYLSNLRNRPLIQDNRIRQLQPLVEQSITPYLKQIASTSSRVGTGSGDFIGELLREAQGRMSEKELAMRWEAIKANAMAPIQISQLMARLV